MGQFREHQFRWSKGFDGDWNLVRFVRRVSTSERELGYLLTVRCSPGAKLILSISSTTTNPPWGSLVSVFPASFTTTVRSANSTSTWSGFFNTKSAHIVSMGECEMVNNSAVGARSRSYR